MVHGRLPVRPLLFEVSGTLLARWPLDGRGFSSRCAKVDNEPSRA